MTGLSARVSRWGAPLACLALFAVASPSAHARAVKSTPKAHVALEPREIFRRSVSDQTGDIFVLTKRGNFLLEDGDFRPEALLSSHVRSEPKPGAPVRKLPPHAITMHGFAWDYDLEIPLAFYDPKGRFFKKGTYPQLAVQQDIAPTLAAVLGIAAPARAQGRVLTEAMISKDSARDVAAGKVRRPKAIIVFVQDQVGKMFLKAHPERVGYFGHLLREGAHFTNAQVAHVDVETAVGHAAVATGGYPRDTGISTNYFFHTGLWEKQPVFSAKLSDKDTREGYPGFYLAPTLSDVWMKSREGKPKILAFATAARAAMAMGGHGAMFKGSPKTHVAYYVDEGEGAGGFSTDENFYQMPKSFSGKKIDRLVDSFLKERNGAWFGHSLKKKDGSLHYKLVRNTPLQSMFEAELMADAIKELEIGADDETDLVWLNMKATDYCGHGFGFESEECGEVLAATAAAAEKVVAALDQATGGDYIAVFTADHGAAPLPEMSGAVRLRRSTLLADLNARFDKIANGVDAAFAVTSSQIYLNVQELKLGGHQVDDVVAFLRGYEVPMEAPLNSLAEEWIAKGKPAKIKFFEDVVSAEELKRPRGRR